MKQKTFEDPTIFIAEGARITGQVEIGSRTGIWYNAVLRGDITSITVGEDCNIQDNVVVHGDEIYDVKIGDRVSVGHSSIIHGCTIDDDAVIGMGSIILNGAHIGKGCLIGAGSLVTKKTVIPDGAMAFGRPAKVVRIMDEKEAEYNTLNWKKYRELAEKALQD
ncbi:MAG: gamma carbonic anhydrase family protein [Clostridium sp.]|nr:gamma carbonic anhydrase family protein [Clostridium sp.]